MTSTLFPARSSDRALPLLIAAVVFLAGLAGAGGIAAAGLARQWRGAAGGAIIEVPDAYADAAAALLGPTAHRLAPAELADALRPWLGDDSGRLAVRLPALFTRPDGVPPDLAQALARAAPGAIVSANTLWQDRLVALADSLRACAALAVGAVGFVATGIIAVATGAGLAARQDSIGIVHHLGATDGLIAGKFAARIAWLALIGGVLGAALSALVLLGLAEMAAPFRLPPAAAPGAGTHLAIGSAALWLMLAALPALAALTGWLTAQATVRLWLRRLA